MQTEAEAGVRGCKPRNRRRQRRALPGASDGTRSAHARLVLRLLASGTMEESVPSVVSHQFVALRWAASGSQHLVCLHLPQSFLCPALCCDLAPRTFQAHSRLGRWWGKRHGALYPLFSVDSVFRLVPC